MATWQIYFLIVFSYFLFLLIIYTKTICFYTLIARNFIPFMFIKTNLGFTFLGSKLTHWLYLKILRNSSLDYFGLTCYYSTYDWFSTEMHLRFERSYYAVELLIILYIHLRYNVHAFEWGAVNNVMVRFPYLPDDDVKDYKRAEIRIGEVYECHVISIGRLLNYDPVNPPTLNHWLIHYLKSLNNLETDGRYFNINIDYVSMIVRSITIKSKI